MKIIIICILILTTYSSNTLAKNRTVTIDVEVLLDGKEPLSGAYINIVKLIPKAFRMPSVNNLGIRVSDRDGRISIQLKNINSKGMLDITLLRDKCNWHSDYYKINLSEAKESNFKVVLKPQSTSCDDQN